MSPAHERERLEGAAGRVLWRGRTSHPPVLIDEPFLIMNAFGGRLWHAERVGAPQAAQVLLAALAVCAPPDEDYLVASEGRLRVLLVAPTHEPEA